MRHVVAPRRVVRPALAAGALGGAAGGLAFALAHLVLVKPVWLLFALGPALGALCGVAFGHARRALDRPGPLVVVLAWACALPAWALAVARALAGAPNAVGFDAPTLAAHLSGFAVGAAIGGLLSRSAKGALAMAAAGGAVTLAGARQILVGGGSQRGIAFFLALAGVAAFAGFVMDRFGISTQERIGGGEDRRA